MFPRPKPGETEDDLLKFQREFLANQTQSSATIVKRGDKRKSEDGNQTETKRDVVKMEGTYIYTHMYSSIIICMYMLLTLFKNIVVFFFSFIYISYKIPYSLYT